MKGNIADGKASALTYLATLKRELDAGDLPLLAILPTAAEMSTGWVKETAAAFNCPVICYYGFAEVNSVGYQLEQGGPYIVPDEHVVVESVARPTNAAASQPSVEQPVQDLLILVVILKESSEFILSPANKHNIMVSRLQPQAAGQTQ